jgi:hypothetical protein
MTIQIIRESEFNQIEGSRRAIAHDHVPSND